MIGKLRQYSCNLCKILILQVKYDIIKNNYISGQGEF